MYNRILSIFKKDIEREIKSIKLKDIISIGLIGSFLYAKHFEKVNDIDLVIILKNLNPLITKKVNNIFKQIAKNLSSSKFKVIVENRIGPFKANPEKGKTIMSLHILLYDLNLLKSVLSTVKYDFANFSKTFLGKQLKKLLNINKINKEDIKNDINNWLNAINKNSIYVIKFKQIGKNKIRQISFKKATNKQMNEELIFTILTGLTNFIRLFKPAFKKKDEVILKESEKILPLNHYLLVEEAIKIKKLLRQNKLSRKRFMKFKMDTINFLRYLSNRLNSKEITLLPPA